MTGENFKKNLSALRRELLATARQYFPDNEKAEDMVQDTLLRLWEMKENLREPINGIANVILRNLAIDNLRRQKPTVNIEQVDIGSPPDNDNHERYLRVMNIIDTLPDMQQTLIRLRLVEGMDYKDISKLTGIKEATIRQIISRARLAIRKQYIKKDESGEKVQYTEITTRYSVPSETAAAMLLRNYDSEWNDRDNISNEMRKQELELRKAIARSNNFDLDLEE